MSVITRPCPKFHGDLAAVWPKRRGLDARAWMSNYIPEKTMDVITYPFITPTRISSLEFASRISCVSNLESSDTLTSRSEMSKGIALMMIFLRLSFIWNIQKNQPINPRQTPETCNMLNFFKLQRLHCPIKYKHLHPRKPTTTINSAMVNYLDVSKASPTPR